MGKPFTGTIKKSHAEDIDNRSGNPAFSQIMDARLSRRSVLQGFGALGVTGILPLGLMSNEAQAATEAARFQPIPRFPRATALGFKSVSFSTKDKVVVPEGYTAQVLYPWGASTGIAGNMPAFKSNAGNSAAEQAAQAGMHHDGMSFFALPLGSQTSDRGLLAMNHEYIDNGLLFPDGTANWSLEKARKGQNAMGISVVEVRRAANGWQVVRPSPFARRITANTPMSVTGRHAATS